MTQRLRESTRASGTVLVVDRDHSSRVTARRLLESAGYVVLDAGDAPAAEQIATVYVGPIHVLLVDRDVPATGTQGLSDRLRQLHPEIKMLVASSRPRRELTGRLDARTPVVRKPFERSRLAATVQAVLAGTR